jgi:4-aminobutyrate aminotransferase-like enzyme
VVKEIEAQDLCTNAALMGEKLIARLNGDAKA